MLICLFAVGVALVRLSALVLLSRLCEVGGLWWETVGLLSV